MSDTAQLQILFTIGLVLWIGVAAYTLPKYYRGLRRAGGIPFLAGMVGLTVANLFEVAFFTYVIWVDPGLGVKHIALLSIPGWIIVRGIAHALVGYAAGVNIREEIHDA